MIDHINSQKENLADIVGISAITPSIPLSPSMLILGTVLITAILLVIYYRFTHNDKSLLKRIKRQTENQQITPREAAHKIAALRLKTTLNTRQKEHLNTLRFASTEPSTEQLSKFIQHVI